MKVICLADTQASSDILKQYFLSCRFYLDQADMIVHLGDGYEEARPYLKAYKNVTCLKGNHDSKNLGLPTESRQNIYGLRILFIHGESQNRLKEQLNIWENKLRWFLGRPPNLTDYYAELYRRYKNKYDIVVYGHIHIPRIERIGKTYFFCPGGFPPKRLLFGHKPSFGMIKLIGTKKSVLPRFYTFNV